MVEKQSDNFLLPVSQKARKFVEELKVTQEEQEAIINIKQRDPLWFKERKYRITASNFGAACGLSPYKTATALAQKLILNKSIKPNFFMKWGIEHEDDAAQRLLNFVLQFDPDAKLSFPGLYVSQKHPFIGVSPDGILHSKLFPGGKIGVEIKCPQRMYSKIPIDYYCQIQGTMAILEMSFYFFVVWTPASCQISIFKFNVDFWKKILYPGLHNFYFNIWKPWESVLETNSIEPVITTKNHENSPKRRRVEEQVDEAKEV